MRNTLILLLLYLVSYQVFGQNDLKITIDDFNKDGVVDTLKTFYKGGSSFGGNYAQIINGKTKDIYELNDDGCFCEIKHVVPIPPELNKDENRPFLETIKKHLLPKIKKAPDASLDWIINSSFANAEVDDNPFFDLIIDPQLSWNDDKLEYPSLYYTEIKGDTLTQLYSTPYEPPEWLYQKANKGFLIYYGHNHYRSKSGDSLKLSASNATYKVFRTSHGVVVKKGNLHKWVFISDYPLTDAPEKLRWESIKTIKLFDKYLIVQQNLYPASIYRLFVINIETGICGRLKHEFLNERHMVDKKIEDFSIQGKSITLNDYGEQISYKLKDIFKELETQYIGN